MSEKSRFFRAVSHRITWKTASLRDGTMTLGMAAGPGRRHKMPGKGRRKLRSRPKKAGLTVAKIRLRPAGSLGFPTNFRYLGGLAIRPRYPHI
jgi:hypothetical protein